MQFRYTKVSDSWRYVSIVLFPLLVIGLLLAGLTGAIMYMCDIEHWSRLYFLIGAGVLLILSCIASQWRNTYNFKFTGKDLTFWVTTPFCRHKKTYERVSRLRMRGIKNSKTSVDHVALGCLAGKKMPYFEPDFSMDVASYNFLLAYFDTWRPHDEEELAPHPKNMFAGLLKGAAQLGVVALRLGGKYFAGADGGVDIGDLDFGDSGSGDFDLGDIGFGDDS